MKNTPGPIVVHGRVKSCEIGGFLAVGRADEPPTAYVAVLDDAKLYAAAPDMFEALSEIHKFWCCPQPKRMKDWSARCDAMADCARKAIAKAEG